MEGATSTTPEAVAVDRTPGSARDGEVLLVVPPFQSCARPALGVSLLKAHLTEAGHSARVLYLNLRFAERIGWWVYEWISHSNYHELLGEFIFAGAYYGHSEEQVRAYVEQALGNPEPDEFLPRFLEGRSLVEKLQYLIREAGEFIRTEAVEEVLAHDPWLVGATSSFHQNCASVALLRAVKERRPEVVTVAGGANCEADMGEELLARFPEVDFVGQGECDRSFVELVAALRGGESRPRVSGILAQGDDRPPESSSPLDSGELERLPLPDFTEFFDHVRSTSAAQHLAPALSMETSRGCWWGAKKHCTFCGLNADGLVFRSKSAERVREELSELVQRHGVRYVAVVDNILDMKYFKTLLPGLAEDRVADLFFETKANLTKDQVKLLADAGIKWIQPGIESLSNLSLELMQKGATKLQNVQLLKWCAEVRVDVNWNYLYGFPGESDEELTQITEEIEALHHLQPAAGAAVLRLDRFSPYFKEPERHGLTPTSPAETYRHVYPFSDESLSRLAYFYESEPLAEKAGGAAFERLNRSITRWGKSFARSYLVSFPSKGRLNVLDTRRCARRRWHRLKGIQREIYEYCDRIRSLRQIREAFDGVDAQELQSILDAMVHNRLMLFDGGRYLSLAVDARLGYRKARFPRGGGYALPPRTSQRLRRDLRLMLKLEVPPGRILGAALRRASNYADAKFTNGLTRAVEWIIRRGTESGPSPTPVARPGR